MNCWNLNCCCHCCWELQYYQYHHPQSIATCIKRNGDWRRDHYICWRDRNEHDLWVEDSVAKTPLESSITLGLEQESSESCWSHRSHEKLRPQWKRFCVESWLTPGRSRQWKYTLILPSCLTNIVTQFILIFTQFYSLQLYSILLNFTDVRTCRTREFNNVSRKLWGRLITGRFHILVYAGRNEMFYSSCRPFGHCLCQAKEYNVVRFIIFIDAIVISSVNWTCWKFTTKTWLYTYISMNTRAYLHFVYLQVH